MNKNLNNKNININNLPQKDNCKKNNIISSLSEVEYFLCNLDYFISNVKLVNLLKKRFK